MNFQQNNKMFVKHKCPPQKSPNCRAFFKISHDPSRNFRAGAFVKKLYIYKKWVLMGLYCSQYGNYWQIYRHENNIKKKINKNLVEDAFNLYALPVKFRNSRFFSSPLGMGPGSCNWENCAVLVQFGKV